MSHHGPLLHFKRNVEDFLDLAAYRKLIWFLHTVASGAATSGQCSSAGMHRTSSKATGTLRERATAVADAAASLTSINFSAQDSTLPVAAHQTDNDFFICSGEA